MRHIVLLLSISIGAALAIAPDTLWTKVYGGTGEDMAYSIAHTSDNGFIICGSTYSFGAIQRDAYIVKCDAAGLAQWTKMYGGSYYDAGYSIIQTSDNGYVMTGSTASFGVGAPTYQNMWLLKMNSSGDTLWTKTYGGTMPEDGNEVIQTADGGFAIAGFTQSWGAGNGDMYIVKTYPNGDTMWTRRFGGQPTWGEGANSIQQTPDHGYIITGYQHNTVDQNLWLVRIDSAGNFMWSKSFGGTMNDMGTSVKVLADTGFVVTGSCGVPGNLWDFYLLLTDSLGDTLWTRTYNRGSSELANDIQVIPGDGFIMAGEAYVDASTTDWWIVKVTSSGDTVWTKTIGYPTQSDRAQSVATNLDGSYLVAGWVWLPPSATNYDMWAVKLAQDPAAVEEVIAGNRAAGTGMIAAATFIDDQIVLNFSDAKRGEARLRLYDIMGRQALDAKCTVMSTKVRLGGKSVTGLAPGVYFAHITLATGEGTNLKLIKR